MAFRYNVHTKFLTYGCMGLCSFRNNLCILHHQQLDISHNLKTQRNTTTPYNTFLLGLLAVVLLEVVEVVVLGSRCINQMGHLMGYMLVVLLVVHQAG